MTTRYQPFVVPELRGLDEGENPHAIPSGDLSKASNVWRLGRSVGTRPGTILDPNEDYVDALAAPVLGIADFRRNRNADRDLVVVVPGAIHTDDATTLTLGAGVDVTNASLRPWTFVQHKNKLYAAGGDVETSDTAWYWDGSGNVTRLGILNNAAANIEPRFLCEFGNRLFAAGFSGSDPSGNPGIVRYSSLNDGTVWPTENTIGGNFSVGGFAADAEEYVTGLSVYKDNSGRWLLVQTNRRLYPILEGPNPSALFTNTDEISVGCASHLLFVNPGVDSGDSVYMSDEGVHSMRVTQEEGARSDRFLSWKIRKTFERINLSRIEWGVAGYWRKHGIAVFAVPTGASQVNDMVLVLDMKDSGEQLTAQSAMWFPWAMAGTDHQLSYLAPGRLSNGATVLFWGDYAGRVGVFTTDFYADIATQYDASFRTKHTDFNAATAEKTLGDLLVDVAAESSADFSPTMRVVLDFGRGETISFPLGVSTSDAFVIGSSALGGGDALAGGGQAIYHNKLYGLGSCYTCAFEFFHNGNDQPFWIHRVAGEVAVTGEGQESES